MSAPSTSGLSVELLLRVIDVKYGYFTLLYFTLLYFTLLYFTLLYFYSMLGYRKYHGCPTALLALTE